MSEQDKPAVTNSQPKPEKTAYQKLKGKYRKYVDFRLEGCTGAEAVRRAGFNFALPKQYAWELNQRPEIQAALAEREAEAMENAGISLTRTWMEIRRIAYFDPAKLVGEKGEHLPLHKIDEDTRAAISGVEVEELYDGTGRDKSRIGDVKRYRVASKLEANKLILQKKGEIVERHEDLTPPAPPVIQIVRYSDSESASDSKPDGDTGTDSPKAD